MTPGCLKSYGSENSLNQHIKLKHKEFWKKNTYTSTKQSENIFFDEKEEDKNEEGIYLFNNNVEEDNSGNQTIDFGKIIENFWR